MARRCAHELTIHRADFEAARGDVGPIDADLAVDGIEEITFFLDIGGVDGRRGTPGDGETMHLHATDHQAGEWLFAFEPDAVQISRLHARGDLALRGQAGDLELLLYQRPTAGPVERFGDDAVLDVFYGEFTFTSRTSPTTPSLPSVP